MRKLSLLPLLRILGAAAALALSVQAGAVVVIAPATFGIGYPMRGDPQSQRPCVHCATWRVDGVVDRIYFRRERLVGIPRVPVAQANYCTVELDPRYFPVEEEHIAAYLNKRYYRFE
jgi:hypothetical protein